MAVEWKKVLLEGDALEGALDDVTLENDGGTVQVKDGGIDTDQLAADAVTGDKIADDAIGSEHIEQLSAALDFGGQQAQDMVVHTVADSDAQALITPVLGKMLWRSDLARPVFCTSAA